MVTNVAVCYTFNITGTKKLSIKNRLLFGNSSKVLEVINQLKSSICLLASANINQLKLCLLYSSLTPALTFVSVTGYNVIVP